jgi:hypothetical protein
VVRALLGGVAVAVRRQYEMRDAIVTEIRALAARVDMPTYELLGVRLRGMDTELTRIPELIEALDEE